MEQDRQEYDPLPANYQATSECARLWNELCDFAAEGRSFWACEVSGTSRFWDFLGDRQVLQAPDGNIVFQYETDQEWSHPKATCHCPDKSQKGCVTRINVRVLLYPLQSEADDNWRPTSVKRMKQVKMDYLTLEGPKCT